MEDAFVATSLEDHIGWEDVDLYAVFDGHGGPQVAEFCAHNMPQLVGQGDRTAATVLLHDVFVSVDEMLMEIARNTPDSELGHPDRVGCTAVVSLVGRDSIIVANAGDSRAVLSRGGRACALSQDHKPHLPKESTRIQKAGGFVTQQRAGHDIISRVNGKLGVARSIGDLSYKRNPVLAATDQLVSCVPDVKSFRRQSDDEFMVIACDGVWDVMTSQQMVDRIKKDLFKIHRGSLQPDALVQKILEECLAPGPKKKYGKGSDNMTMILIVFDQQSGVAIPAHCSLPGLLTGCLNPSRAPSKHLKQGDGIIKPPRVKKGTPSMDNENLGSSECNRVKDRYGRMPHGKEKQGPSSPSQGMFDAADSSSKVEK